MYNNDLEVKEVTLKPKVKDYLNFKSKKLMVASISLIETDDLASHTTLYFSTVIKVLF
jgi:hypothetical protein